MTPSHLGAYEDLCAHADKRGLHVEIAAADQPPAMPTRLDELRIVETKTKRTIAATALDGVSGHDIDIAAGVLLGALGAQT